MKKGTIILLVILGIAALIAVWYFFFRTPQGTELDSQAMQIPEEVIRQSDAFEDGEAFRHGGLTYIKTGDTWVVA